VNTTLEPEAVSPHAEYSRRLDANQREEARQIRRERIIGNARVWVFLPFAVLGSVLFSVEKTPAVFWYIFLAVSFLILLFYHQRVLRAWQRAGRAVAFYEKGLARLEDRWAGEGQPGTRFLTGDHPYAADLDLFGTGSLFERLCTVRTRMGEDTLAAWLRAPAAPEEIRARQAAVAELRARLDLREALALLAADVPAGVGFEALAAWGTAAPVLGSRTLRLAAFVLAALSMATLVSWVAFGAGLFPFLAVLVLQVGFALRLSARVQQVISAVDRRARDLVLLAGLLVRLERTRFAAPRLTQLQAALRTAGVPPSQRLARLAHLLDLLDSRRNPYFAPVAALLLWTTQLAFALEAWRAAAGPGLPRWLAAVGEFEALCALAAYAYENPADPFPEIVPAGPRFEGEGLGHPLIPAARCVRNDLHLGSDLRVLVVSGSNMSGKSTWLRTVGANAVLALAGAPVRATRLLLSPVSVGATLRIQDSLQAGSSRFFAEITRMRQLVELAKGSPPLLFLLDEILHGTNSHDRRLGAEAVVRSLVNYGAIGMVTTHDLALADIADVLAPRAANVHFEDHFEHGTITFDYRMRPGVVRNSNALALMRSVGLEV
jgi:hypothetical protein